MNLTKFPYTYCRLPALGVGSKTMVPSASLELVTEGLTPDELDVLKSTESPVDVDVTAMETADAAAVVRASQVSPTSTRSSAAMQSLMEQGTCNVDLVYSYLISNDT